jgi:hypothetical protein
MSTDNGSHTPYLRLGYGVDSEENRNWALIDTKAFDLARSVITNIPAGGVLAGFYPDPSFAPGAIHNADVSDVAWSKVTGAPAPVPGPTGPVGPGVAAGGTTGQVLSKASATDYDTTWTTSAAGAALAYRHVQASAATTWTIPHNLTFRPNVTAVDSTGREIVPGALDYSSATTVTLTFSAAVGGEAYCS